MLPNGYRRPSHSTRLCPKVNRRSDTKKNMGTSSVNISPVRVFGWKKKDISGNYIRIRSLLCRAAGIQRRQTMFSYYVERPERDACESTLNLVALLLRRFIGRSAGVLQALSPHARRGIEQQLIGADSWMQSHLTKTPVLRIQYGEYSGPGEAVNGPHHWQIIRPRPAAGNASAPN